MNFKLAYNNSGDVIPVQAINSDSYKVVEYYVDQLITADTNRFNIQNSSSLVKRLENLQNNIEECNEYIEALLGSKIPFYSLQDLLDSHVTNDLHAFWVNSQRQQVNIKERLLANPNSAVLQQVASLFNNDVEELMTIVYAIKQEEHYRLINTYVHAIEETWMDVVCSCNTDDWFTCPNPFGTKLLSNGLSNLTMRHHHLGRVLHNKFRFNDIELEYDDENSFDEFLGIIDIQFVTPETIPLSPEFKAWCAKHGREPFGRMLNLGNFEDYDTKQHEYKKIVYRNMLAGNTFSIEL